MQLLVGEVGTYIELSRSMHVDYVFNVEVGILSKVVS